MQTVAELTSQFPRTGTLVWIGRASARREAIESVELIEVEVGTGLVGEHHAQSGRSKRQVTLIQAEHLPVVAALLGRNEVAPELLRRNLVVSGINLLALKKQRFRIGGVILVGTGPCEPCSRMEETLGTGGYNAMRGHGGLCATVEQPGTIKIGDRVEALPEPSSAKESVQKSGRVKFMDG